MLLLHNYYETLSEFHAALEARKEELFTTLLHARQSYWSHVQLYGCRDTASAMPVHENGYPPRASF
jgi:hypothetical protein